MKEDVISVSQAAELLGIHRQTVYQAIREGRLPSVEVLGHVAVRRKDAEAYRERTEGITKVGGRPRSRVDAPAAEKRGPGRPRKDRGEGITQS